MKPMSISEKRLIQLSKQKYDASKKVYVWLNKGGQTLGQL